MTAKPSTADAFPARLRALGEAVPVPAAPYLPTALPAAGALAGVNPTDIPGGLAISAWFFRRRLRAFGTGGDTSLYRSPFDPAPVED